MSRLCRLRTTATRTSALIVASLLLFAAGALRAQGFGTVIGNVTDASGAAVPSASVTATAVQTGTQQTVVSNGDGHYTFPSLQPTQYTISVAAPGFEKFTQTDVVLEANQSITVNVKLQVGAATETVTVTSAVPQVDTSSGTLSQVVDRERVVDLPLNGRNAATLVTLVAGVSAAPSNGLDQGTSKTFPVAVSITANGTQANQQNYLLNGGNNVDEMTNVNAPFPFPDALQEFSVQTSNYNAQYGQSAGAVVNIVTKSGTEQFHGSAFEFVRNGFFNAKPYFALTADALHRHQFGGTIGGPVILPKISSGKLTQFFFGYQHTLVHVNSSQNSAVVPTLAEEGRAPGISYADYGTLCSAGFDLSGHCTNLAQQIFNPFNGAEYAYNRIPATDFDPAAVQILQHIPTYSGTPAAGKVGGTVFFFKPTTQTYNEYLGRVDHQFGDRDLLFVDYYYNDFDQKGVFNPDNLLTYQSFSNIRYQNALINETHTFTPNLLNNLILNYQREISLRGGPPGSTNVTDYGVQNVWQPPQNALLNRIAATGYFTVSGSAFADFARNNYTLNDDLHWTKGNHNFGFGGHIELSRYDLTNIGTLNGSFTSAAVTVNANVPSLNFVNAISNFQMGYLSGFAQGTAEYLADRNRFPGLYVQDSWRIARRLTLNYGVRWEEFAPWTNKFDETTIFNPSAYTSNTRSKVFTSLPAGFLVAGDAGVVSQGVRSQYKQFMPRVGFAWDVLGTGLTTVRGGGGIFFQDRLPGFFNQSQGSFPPFTISVSQTNLGGTNVGGPLSNPYCTGCTAGKGTAGPIPNPFPYTLPFSSSQTFPTPLTLTEYDPSGNFQVPVTYDYNLTVEQQLFANWAMRVAYVGSQSRHQFVNLELNPAVNTGSSLSTNQRRPYNTAPVVAPCSTAAGCAAAYADILVASMSGATNFNSLQATLEKRISHGLSLLVNYTWSRALDDMPYTLNVSNVQDLNAGESYVYPVYPAGSSNWYPANYKALDYGPSDFDHPSVLSASYVFALPRLHEGNGFVRGIVNGWRTTGLVQHRTGDALTLSAGKDVSLTGLSQDRAQRTAYVATYSSQSGKGSCSGTTSCVNWIDPSAFALPVNSGPGTGFGNVQKGSVRGPAYTDWDAAVIRTFPVWRESTLDFRAEYFDLLNHTILGDPSTSVSAGTFGQITSENSAGPRIAQFSLKLAF